MDIKVYETQCWLNETYSKYPAFAVLDTDGITGTKTIQGLIRALQIELEVDVDGVFGADTLEAFTPLNDSSDNTDPSIKNQIYILQGALYCKGQGLNPGDLNGIYGIETGNAVKLFKTYAGLSSPSTTATAEVMQALLNTDAYTLLANGDSNIRTIQQDLNNKYHTEIGLIPCDGVYSRRTNRALISGLQFEERKEDGFENTVVDGIWGDTTMNRCPTLRRYGTVSNKNYVYLLQYALYVNGYDPNGFDGGFGAGVDSAVKKFQSFVGLTSDGIVGKSTWASLLVSYGDKTRKGTACDCMTPLTEATANTLVSNGRTAVGRYLTGGSHKVLSYRELEIIHNAGLRVIPIYQTTNNKASYFKEKKGKQDAYYAYNALVNFKFPAGTIVYFAVDYDATEADVNSRIIPYFKGIKEVFDETDISHGYKIGIYGPRYVCTLVREAGYSVSSFVCDMSSGFLCNIGHTLPSDWAFDQIHTLKIGSGSGEIEIDNDIASGRNQGALVDVNGDFDISDSDLTATKIARIQKILQSQNLDIYGFDFGYNYEIEYKALDCGLIKVYYCIHGDEYHVDDAIISLNSGVTNGRFESLTFESQVENVISSMNLGTYEDNCLDITSVAQAVQAGNISVEISADMVKRTISVSLISTVYTDDQGARKIDYSVEIRYEIDLDGDQPVNMPQADYDRVLNWLRTRDWETIGVEILVALAIIGLIFLMVSQPETVPAVAIVMSRLVTQFA